MNLELEPSTAAITQKSALEKKLDSYLMQAGIKDKAAARSLAKGHFSAHADEYPYLLFRGRTLYFFTAGGLSAAELLPGTSNADCLRFDGERITRLDPLYYLGPEGEKSTDGAAVFWSDGFSNNNNNNGNNNG